MLHEPILSDTAGPLAHAAFGAALTACLLEQMDHGILLLGDGGRLLHANRVAHRECLQHGTLRLEQGRLTAVRGGDAEAVAAALAAAARGLRTLLHFDGRPQCLPLLVLPLTTLPAVDGRRPTGITVAMLSKRGGTEPLNIELFARAVGLTPAERAVLRGLSRGLAPAALSGLHGVAVSTVRTQIVSIRQKTRTDSIRALLDLVHHLPPVVCSTEVHH